MVYGDEIAFSPISSISQILQMNSYGVTGVSLSANIFSTFSAENFGKCLPFREECFREFRHMLKNGLVKMPS